MRGRSMLFCLLALLATATTGCGLDLLAQVVAGADADEDPKPSRRKKKKKKKRENGSSAVSPAKTKPLKTTRASLHSTYLDDEDQSRTVYCSWTLARDGYEVPRSFKPFEPALCYFDKANETIGLTAERITKLTVGGKTFVLEPGNTKVRFAPAC